VEAFGYGILTVGGPMLSSAAIPTRGLMHHHETLVALEVHAGKKVPDTFFF